MSSSQYNEFRTESPSISYICSKCDFSRFLDLQPAPKTCSRSHLAQPKSITKTDFGPRQP